MRLPAGFGLPGSGMLLGMGEYVVYKVFVGDLRVLQVSVPEGQDGPVLIHKYGDVDEDIALRVNAGAELDRISPVHVKRYCDAAIHPPGPIVTHVPMYEFVETTWKPAPPGTYKRKPKKA